MKANEIIRNEILRKYPSVRQFAKDAGIANSTLNSALTKEDGFENMSLSNAKKVSATLGISIDMFIDLLENNEEKIEIENAKILNHLDPKGILNKFYSLSERNQNRICEALDDYIELESRRDIYLAAAAGSKDLKREDLTEDVNLVLDLEDK